MNAQSLYLAMVLAGFASFIGALFSASVWSKLKK